MRRKLRIKRVLFTLFLLCLIVFVIGYSLKPVPEIILLSFDTEPVDSPQDVNSVLELLDKHNISATFFVTGDFVNQNYLLYEKIKQKHEVACHSYTHPDFLTIDLDEKKMQLRPCLLIGTKGFRAPYNKIDQETFQLLKESGFTYDASIIENLPTYPEPTIAEIKSSSFCFVPLSDVVFTHNLKLPSKFFFLTIKTKKAKVVSIQLHPHRVSAYLDELDKTIVWFKSRNIKFMSHLDYYDSYLKKE